MHVTFRVVGIEGSDQMYGRKTQEKRKSDEDWTEYDDRTWQQKLCRTGQQKLWLDDQKLLVLSPFCVTNSLVEAAIWLDEITIQVVRLSAGKLSGSKTFTTRFLSGITPGRAPEVFVRNGKGEWRRAEIKDVKPVTINVPADGKRGSKKRVDRVFPALHNWAAEGDCYVWDELITKEVFTRHFETVGRFIGWGSMRRGGGGVNGSFTVASLGFEAISGRDATGPEPTRQDLT